VIPGSKREQVREREDEKAKKGFNRAIAGLQLWEKED
jgi:hypothetical protein